jgi:hypothetical protein
MTEKQIETPLEYFRSKANSLGVGHLMRRGWLFEYEIPVNLTRSQISESLRDTETYSVQRDVSVQKVIVHSDVLNSTARAYSGSEGHDGSAWNFSQCVIYGSAPTKNGVMVLSGEGIESKLQVSGLPDFRKNAPRVPENVQLTDSSRFFYFGIRGLYLHGSFFSPDVGFRVRGFEISSPTINTGGLPTFLDFKVPEGLFATGKDYKPGVDWLLETYAASMTGNLR